MLIGKVVGNIWSTKKIDQISSLRLLLIEPVDSKLKKTGNMLVAADEVGAGFGEFVIVTEGAPAMEAFDREEPVPVDAVVIGIVDNTDMVKESKGTKR